MNERVIQRINNFIQGLAQGRISIRSVSEEDLIIHEANLKLSLQEGTPRQKQIRKTYHQIIKNELKRREKISQGEINAVHFSHCSNLFNVIVLVFFQAILGLGQAISKGETPKVGCAGGLIVVLGIYKFQQWFKDQKILRKDSHNQYYFLFVKAI